MDSPVFSKPRLVERPEDVKYWGASARATVRVARVVTSEMPNFDRTATGQPACVVHATAAVLVDT